MASNTVNVMLDWYLNPNHAPLFVAKKFGFFKAQGLTVNLISPSSPGDAIKFVASNQADLAVTYEPKLLFAIQEKLPVVLAGVLIDKPLSCLVTQANIHQLSALRGKRIAASDSASKHTRLKTMLKAAKLSIDDVTIIQAHYGVLQALMMHKVAAATGLSRNVEVVLLKEKKFPVRVYYPENYGYPKIDALVFVTKPAYQRTIAYKKFLKALTEADRFLQAHPERCYEAFVHEYREQDNTLTRKIWMATLPYFAREPAIIDQKKLKKLASFLKSEVLNSKS